MAVLLNDLSNLCFRLDLRARAADGTQGPASLRAAVSVDAWRRHAGDEPAFVRLVGADDREVLDLDVISLVEALEALLSGQASEADVGSARSLDFHLRASPLEAEGGAGAAGYLVEAGLDLSPALESVGGAPVEPGREVALFRFATTPRALAAFAAALADEYGRFPARPPRGPVGERA